MQGFLFLDFYSLLPHSFTLSSPGRCQNHREEVLQKDWLNTTLFQSLSDDIFVQVSPQVMFLWPSICRDWRVKEVRWLWSCCGPCCWAKCWRTTRKTEREERVAAVLRGCYAGQASPASPGTAFEVSPWGAAQASWGTSLFVSRKKAVYVIPHHITREPSRRNQGEIPWKKKTHSK